MSAPETEDRKDRRIRPLRILVAVSVLCFLLAIFVPGGWGPGHHVAARRAQANQEIASILTAFKAHQLEHGQFPLTDRLGVVDTEWIALTKNSPEGWALLTHLMGMTEELTMIPEAIAFYEPRYATKPTNGFYTSEEGDAPPGLYDPWGNPFLIRLDLDGDRQIREAGVDSKFLQTEVLVASPGKEGKPIKGDGRDFVPDEHSRKSWE